MKRYAVDVKYYEEDEVFIGTSKDIPGLTLETESFSEMVEEAMDIVPQLLASNLKIANERVEVQIRETKRSASKDNPEIPHPTYIVSDAYAIA